MNEPLAGVVVDLGLAGLDELIPAVEVMIQQGLTTFVIAAKNPEFSTLNSIFGSRVRFGVNRIKSTDQADDAIAAGASFVLFDGAKEEFADPKSPVANYLSALTPTEIAAVAELPVSGVQIYPADTFGPNYADALAKLELIDRCIPASGITSYAAGRWFDAGAPAVLVAEQLLGDALTGGDLGALRERCTSYITG
ncbi:MAG: hypothetical protein CR979_03815 [Propionibacterium sp.]|nr:MAG: hypothetical protein CR979_03815 [Propionibacterium sp.]